METVHLNSVLRAVAVSLNPLKATLAGTEQASRGSLGNITILY